MGKRSMRRENERKNFRRKLSIIVLLIISFIIFNIFYGFYKENKIKEKEFSSDKEIINKEENDIGQEKITITKKLNVNIPKEYKGFNVIARLEIPKIKLDTYILEEYTKEGMDVCPTKFWGPNPNEIGNFCITGHNYKKDKMFSELINLEIGDEIILSDNINGEKIYNIYDIYKVSPNNTESLGQNTNGKKEITLITCVNYSDKRLIIKAREN